MYFFQPNTLKGAQEEIANFVSEEKHIGFHWRKAQVKFNKLVRKNVFVTRVWKFAMYNFAVSMCIYRGQTIRQSFFQINFLKTSDINRHISDTSQRKHLSHKTLFQSHVHSINTEHELVLPNLTDV